MNNSSQNTSEVVNRFSRVYLGDSVIERIEIDMICDQMTFLCNYALLIDANNPNIFEPERRYQPAYLTFDEVKCFSCPEANFCLNNTIVSFDARPASEEGLTEFRMDMTGGFYDESFMRSFIILARDFSLA